MVKRKSKKSYKPTKRQTTKLKKLTEKRKSLQLVKKLQNEKRSVHKKISRENQRIKSLKHETSITKGMLTLGNLVRGLRKTNKALKTANKKYRKWRKL